VFLSSRFIFDFRFLSNRFNYVHENTDVIWKFQRYELINEYEQTYAFPPPLSFILYVILIHNWIKKEASKRRGQPFMNCSIETAAVIPLSDHVMSLERESAEEYVNVTNMNIDESKDLIKTMAEKIEQMELKLNQVAHMQNEANLDREK
jgi:hypothetical protein